MNKTNPLSTPMIVRSLNVKNELFHPHENNEELLGPEVSYICASRALIYLAKYI